MATMKPIIKSTLTPSSKPGNLKRKLEDIDPIDEIEEPKSMIFLHDRSFCRVIIFVVVLVDRIFYHMKLRIIAQSRIILIYFSLTYIYRTCHRIKNLLMFIGPSISKLNIIAGNIFLNFRSQCCNVVIRNSCIMCDEENNNNTEWNGLGP